MKIAILSPEDFEKAETFIQNHIENLPFEKVVIYGGGRPHLAKNHLPGRYQKLYFKAIGYVKRKFGLKVESFQSHCLKKILIQEKVEVVFAEYLITGAEAVKVCEELKIPIVAIALGYEISAYTILEKYEIKYRKLFQYATNIIIVSEHMKKNLLALDCPIDKIIYSPAGPKKDFFDIEPKFKKRQLLAVGRFVNKKAPHLTLLAFQKVLLEMPDTNLVMAGDGPLLNTCKDLVNALNMQKSVSFVGKISPEQHKELLKESYMFVQHSKVAASGDSEGTPVAILEASAAGLPVISTIHAGIPDVIIDGITGLLSEEHDIDTMANNMVRLLDNPDLAKQMGTAGKEYVKKHFSLERHIETLQKVLNEAISKS